MFYNFTLFNNLHLRNCIFSNVILSKDKHMFVCMHVHMYVYFYHHIACNLYIHVYIKRVLNEHVFIAYNLDIA